MSLTGKTVEEQIWNFLIGKGLNAFGAAGLMGNLYAESALIPTNLQNTYEKSLGMTDAQYTAAVDAGTYTNFVRDSAGYGLAQWTYWSRKEALLNYVQAAKASIGDLEIQLGFLWKELSEGYASVLTTLKNATSVRAASDAVLTKFERPADQSESVKKKRASYGQTYYDKYAVKSTAPTTAGGRTMIKTNTDLAAMLKKIATSYKTLYVMGCFGAPMTETNKKRYCSNHSYNQQAARTAMIKAATADTFGFDCVCLIKGVLWGWNGDAGKIYGGAAYASNGVPDISADAMIAKCKGLSTDFSRIEIGEAVWLPGHIGVYIGDGLAVECTPAFKNCVQITAVQNIGGKSGYAARKWTKHGKLPYITYESNNLAQPQPSSPAASGHKVGDIVTFTGSIHYTNANAASGQACKPGKAKVTRVYNGKHAYHLEAVSGGGSTVHGWVDAADIKEAAAGNSWQADGCEIKIGDTVQYSGTVHYNSSYASAKGSVCKGGTAKVTAISKGKPHPYHLKHTGKGCTVYGWCDASDIEGACVTAGAGSFKIGDSVSFTGDKQYTSSYAGATCKSAKPCKAKITAMNQNGKYPYHVVGDTVYGWVSASTISN